MPKLKLKIQYNKNEGLIMSPSELIENYLFGIPMSNNDGKVLSVQAIKNHIANAQQKIENLFSIKLTKQVIEESRDFVREEFNCWGYIRTMYPIVSVDGLKGYINDVCQITYPKEWISLKKISQVAIYRNIYLIANMGGGSQMNQNSLIFNGISPSMGWFGQKFIPNYWRMSYVTGWDVTPKDLFDFISKMAAVSVLGIIGDVLYGVGITNIQVSLDGVSQNTPLSRSAAGGLFQGRIKMYIEDMKETFPNIKNQYRGITFEVL